MLRIIDALIRSNLTLYSLIRSSAVFLSRYIFLEEGFSFLKFIEPRPGMVAIDVGSNDGTSIQMIKRAHPDVLIHSFDPVIRPKNVGEKVIFHNHALSDEDGNLILHVPKVSRWTLTQYASSDREKVEAQLHGDFDVKSSEIAFTILESRCLLLDSLNLEPYFLKIDVEGHEEQVIKGGLKTIIKSSPVLLIEIQSLDRYRTIRSIMEELGYFNLDWPQRNRIKNLRAHGTYSSRRNNYLWLPIRDSMNWNFKKTI